MCKRLFVANIHFEVSEKELTELFSPYGPLKDCFIIRSRTTGRSRGFAFVEFHDEQSAGLAMKELDGVEFHGRKLNILPAKERTNYDKSDS